MYSLDLIGTFVFAISGALAAGENKMDVFGAFVIAFVTAVGGGTIRDLLIGSLPVGWMLDLNYLVVIVLGLGVAVWFRASVLRFNKTMFLFDAIGIGLFTILGVQKTLSIGLSPVVAVMMGAVSAVFGGVLRDVLSNRVPLIFRKEIYATACLFGGIVYIVLEYTGLPPVLRMFISMIAIIVLRILAVKKHWSLPTLQ